MMAIRVRKDGTMWCAALTPEMPGDVYIDDELHYQLSVVHGLIVALPMPEHTARPQWWWKNNAPIEADFSMIKDQDLNTISDDRARGPFVKVDLEGL